MREKLFHYCSINTLRLILENQSFRFSSLDTVDDMEESMTSDYDNIGKICFISCWTDLEQESIDMWRGYTDQGKGVRIGLPKNFFKETFFEEDRLKIFEDFREKEDIFISPPYVPELIPVTYTKDESLIHISVLQENNTKCEKCNSETKNLNISTENLGKFKRYFWLGQSEWRYKLIAIPCEFYDINRSGAHVRKDKSPEESINLMKSDLINSKFKNNFIDYPVDKNALEDIEITTSPLNDERDNKEVEEIVKKYLVDKEHKISESTLQIRK